MTALGQSLPTINKNINELMEEGLIRSDGLFESTGGRKAAVLKCAADARCAIGVELLEDYVFIVLLDLYGNVIDSDTLECRHENSDGYYSRMYRFLHDFIERLPYSREHVLGMNIAVQGIPDHEHTKLIYGKILQNTGITAKMFADHAGMDCRLIHDSEAAAFAESFFRPNLRDSSYIFLNKYMGSASIVGSDIYNGNHGRGQLVEHLRIVPGGRTCYCGQKGCAECYCSAESLRIMSGQETAEFFRSLREENKEGPKKIWDTYLDYLALTLYNVEMVMDVDIIIGGKLRSYMEEEDLEKLKARIRGNSDFEITDRSISLEQTTEHPAAKGAALILIKEFLDGYEK